jgi:hypothetical protein
MHCSRLPRITPHLMIDMLGLDRNENNDGRHKLSRPSVVKGDNPGLDNSRKRTVNSWLTQINGYEFVS